jgi:MoaA/NifB/PqqE/SkfB family radical SAM enzyme
MYIYEDIIQLHLEVSSRCNAACPVCNRTLNGGPKNPKMIETDVTLEQIKQWFPVEFIKQLRTLVLCGNYGDPMTAPELLDIVRYFRETNLDLEINMNTNGGTRTPAFWRELSELIYPKGQVIFSVDGLRDTNHIYRRGVNWDNVERNMRAYCQGPGNSDWEFLVFAHNEHQVEEARALAQEIGIKKFFPKKAFGFQNWDNGTSTVINVLKEDMELDYQIFPPGTPDYRNKTIIDIKAINSTYNKNNLKAVDSMFNDDSFDNYDIDHLIKLARTPIKCRSAIYLEIFVNAEGIVFPCCFTASRFYGNNYVANNQIKKFTRDFGLEKITLSDSVSLKDVVSSDLWQKHYPENWNSDNPEEKLQICSSFCGITEEIDSVLEHKTKKIRKPRRLE